MKFLIRLVLLATGIFAVSYFFPSLIRVDSFTTALVAAVLLSLVNAFIRPLIYVLTLPIRLLTLGLVTFVINGAMLFLVSAVFPRFKVMGWWQAILAAFLISLLSSILNQFLEDEND